jgi:hypothetical protein
VSVRYDVLSDRGQTVTEYLMILGLTTAMILSLQVIVIPAIRSVVGALLKHMATCVSSVAPGCIPK